MFDLNDEDSTRVIKHDPWDSEDYGQTKPEATGHELDSEENEALYRRLVGYYQTEIERQGDNRLQMAIDEDFYDSIQWTAEEEQILAGRGQSATTYNVIAQTCNWIIGSEKRGRSDFKVLPRGKEDAKPAERKTQLMKYLGDCNHTPFHVSRAFEDAVKVGVGWLEDAVQDDDDSEPIYDRYESWRNMLWDSAHSEMDLGDCRWVSRSKWVDLDIAEAFLPDRADVLKLATVNDLNMGFDYEFADEPMDQPEMEHDLARDINTLSAGRRQRVRLIEMWFRKPVRAQKITKGQFRGQEFDEHHPGHAAEIAKAGPGIVAEKLMMKMHVAIFCSKGLLYLGESPYRHNKFPFTPIWAYRRGRDGLPYGVIRGLRDIQVDINKRMSKALYILSSNKVIMDEGAVEDLDEFREEVARPDAIIEKKAGKELILNADRDLAPAHLDLMGRNIQMIQQVGGVTDEQMGRTTNAKSGIAIQARQEQGAMTTSKLFDNLRFAFQLRGEKRLALIEQYMTEQQQFRITNERGQPEFIDVNDGLPDNDIVRSKADFVISEQEWRASLRQAQAETLMEMITRMPPQVGIVLLDLVVETMDVPNREELVKRIRSLNGQEDPDADPNDPEVQARKQAQAQQQQLQQMMVEAELREKLAKAGKTEAEQKKIISQLAPELVARRMETLQKAIDAALRSLEQPLATDVADGILTEAGFVSAPEQAARERLAAEQQQAQQQQAMAAQQQQQAAPPEQQQALPLDSPQ